MPARHLASFRHFIFLILILALFLAACRTQPTAIPSPTSTSKPPTATVTLLPSATITLKATDTATFTDKPTAAPSPTRTPTPTLTQIPTPSFTPTITPTPYPPERLVFVEQRTADRQRGIAFINSDGSGYERPEFLKPYAGTSEERLDGIYLSPSPDGHYLAFDGSYIINSCGDQNPDSPSNCFTINSGIFVADLQNQTIVGNIEATSDNPSWAPDSQQLVASIAVNLPDSNGEVWIKHNLVIYNLQKGQIQHFLESFSDDLFPAWSPDGQWIAFYRSVPRYPCREDDCTNSLYIVHSDGSGLKLLVEDIFNDLYSHIAPTWSPDSQWLAVLSAEHELLLANVYSGEIRHLGITLAKPPQWSPDGSRLIFYADIKGPGVYAISSDGSKLETLVFVIGCCVPELSPSGHFIAFLGNGFSVMNTDGTNSWKLEYELGAPYPDWLPSR